ncbi:BTB/POZ domain-containing protein [Dichanthelium oligosanthes]|uniref:BTB/POZ domain-containing protein n=1 Tax=Dichanthelium oligosanthes TaxID=888268 RepID=A0A1E5V2M0_9POAL|nr:BTB/POZ domain-containing protein [Dichanthelium oligosanthes]
MDSEPDVELRGLDIDVELDPEDLQPSVPLKKVPGGDLFEAARAGDCDRLALLLEAGANVNARDRWDSVALYYACLAGHAEAARMLLEAGAVCAERTFDGDRCHYAALNLRLRWLLKSFEARPPPLAPLPAALRATFLACPANSAAFLEMLQGSAGAETAALASAAGECCLLAYFLQHNVIYFDCSLCSITYRRCLNIYTEYSGFGPKVNLSSACLFPPDITFYVDGKPIEAHRVILCARSPFFEKKFKTDWKDRKEVRFSNQKLYYGALYSLIHFFYSDRLEVAVDDMENLARACKVCKCEELQKILDKEVVHQTYAEYKSARELDLDNSQKRFILQAQSLPEEDRLPSALQRILQTCLAKSTEESSYSEESNEMHKNSEEDLADLYIKVGDKVFHCHKVILASRSEYFRARLSRTVDFLEGNCGFQAAQNLQLLEEHDLSAEAFEKMLEYMYTDKLEHLDPDQAEELFDVASRYLLFPLKRAVADMLLPHLQHVSPAELCHWLMLSDIYGVMKIREYILDIIACNFEMFTNTREFRALLLTLPPPSGDDSLRTTHPSAPGSAGNTDQGNILDDLREKWLEEEGAELDERDESAALFDKRLETLMLVAEEEADDEDA